MRAITTSRLTILCHSGLQGCVLVHGRSDGDILRHAAAALSEPGFLAGVTHLMLFSDAGKGCFDDLETYLPGVVRDTFVQPGTVAMEKSLV